MSGPPTLPSPGRGFQRFSSPLDPEAGEIVGIRSGRGQEMEEEEEDPSSIFIEEGRRRRSMKRRRILPPSHDLS
ncbi:Os03g0417866 [Oryza sativa Japonica Group]|jgi:hypothetical protein|uniref:Os03g0417866 protein n=1 Tax=Oryza sativa subsp. japonica TaxID=39947 RepID=A0A0P0VYP1_ORYSJ|nr:Os03g0417866 [Oryza sativa Japonica Group]